MVSIKIALIKQLIALISSLIIALSGGPKIAGSGTPPSTLTEVPGIVNVKLTNGTYYNFFKNDKTGDILTVPITKAEYYALQTTDQPKAPDGYTWVNSGANEYATSTPVLQDNQYYVSGADVASSTLVTIKVPNLPSKVIPQSDIVNGQLSATGLIDINK